MAGDRPQGTACYFFSRIDRRAAAATPAARDGTLAAAARRRRFHTRFDYRGAGAGERGRGGGGYSVSHADWRAATGHTGGADRLFTGIVAARNSVDRRTVAYRPAPRNPPATGISA